MHASWLNQVEIYFSILQRKALTPNDFPSLEALEERLQGFARHYETIAKPFEWKFTRKDLDSLLHRIDCARACKQPCSKPRRIRARNMTHGHLAQQREDVYHLPAPMPSTLPVLRRHSLSGRQAPGNGSVDPPVVSRWNRCFRQSQSAPQRQRSVRHFVARQPREKAHAKQGQVHVSSVDRRPDILQGNRPDCDAAQPD